MLLSIIIPVYNVINYLGETLANVLQQSFSDYELLLIDDGSTDGSAEICEQFAATDHRVRVIHQQNAGVSAARNSGVAAAQGKYIGFVDSDDLIEPNMFETLVTIAEKNQADVVQCRHNRLACVQGITVSGEERLLDGITFVCELFDYTGREYTNQVALWSKIYRRELFEGIHFPDGRTYEDEQETYKLCLKANRMIQIPDELYHYIKRENSIITGVSARKILDKQAALMDRLLYLPKRIPSLEEACMKAFYGYSLQSLCKLYAAKEKEAFARCKDSVLLYQNKWYPMVSKYDRLYWFLISHHLLEKWIFKHDFEPIQRLRKR